MHRVLPLGLGILVGLVGAGCSSSTKKNDFDLPVRFKTEVMKPEVSHQAEPSEGMSLVNQAPVVDPVTPVVDPVTTVAGPGAPIVAGGPDVPGPVPGLPLIPAPPIFIGNDDDDHEHRQRQKVEEILFVDDFDAPFSVGTTTEKWSYFAFPPFVGNDGIETVSNGILTVRSKGVNGVTQEPAFTLTVPQETMPTDTPGGVDHVKWLVYTNHLNTETNIPGYKAVDGKELVCETWLRGQTFGTAGNPFGAAAEPNDIRLANFALNGIDFETFMVFDFFITNAKIYAYYERLPFGRGGPLGNYAAFSYAVPVMDRTPSNFHHLEIAYDRENGVVRWLIDEKEVFKVTAIGKRISDEFLTLNHGGTEPTNPLVLNQLNCGMGHFTLLDAFLPTQQTLVKLTTAPNFYFNPLTDVPLTNADFIDPLSLMTSRLFGQGVETQVKKYQVKYVSFE